MSDLIERQAAIEAIVAWTVEDRPDIEMPTDLVGRIEALPSAYPERCECCETLSKTQLLIPQPEQQWIPCSERLPSRADHIDNMVLVCYGNGSVRFNTYMNGWVQGNPVAWMPLPEPYKGEQE